ncbi:MAG: hypothetical protein LBM70_02210 [Victivallales bacterium]|jgi:hypothetical protein|nr:hypothetical protein [Victivallales bacterium]
MNMKTIIVAGFCCICWGCAPTITVNNVSYKVLTVKEERHLIEIARRLLIRPGKVLTAQEVNVVQRQEPQLEIVYSDDFFGEATVRWTTPKKIIEVHFDGELNQESVTVSISTEEVQPDLIRYTDSKK